MQTSSPQEVVRDASLAPADIVQLARLEFGKPCVDHEGPIVGSGEHRQLGWSEGFPPQLISLCEPSIIGVFSDELENLPATCPHATTLRPVLMAREGGNQSQDIGPLANRQVIPVMCRLRKRPEDGEKGIKRKYKLARYLVAQSTMLDPFSFFNAMDSEPLLALTPEEIQAIQPLAKPRLALAPPNHLKIRFLQEALIYILSGIPISIAEYIEEKVFFEWVAALSHFLPVTLRPYLSAGWGVASSLSGKLAVTYTAQSAETCAVFYPQSDKWVAPFCAIDLDEKNKLVRRSFVSDRVTPGLHYVWYLFGRPVGELPKRMPPALAAKAERLKEPPQRDNYPSDLVIPDFQDTITPGTFRYSGWNAYNHYLIMQLKRHLNFKDDASMKNFSPQMSTLIYREQKREAFTIAFRAMKTPRARLRADQVVWDMMRHYGTSIFSKFIASTREPWSARLRLFSVLQEAGDNPTPADALRVLQRLVNCARRSKADDLPDEAVKRLGACLSAGLNHIDDYSASLHERLLRIESPPKAYLDWLPENDFELALSLLNQVSFRRLGACGIVEEKTGSSAVKTAMNFAMGSYPSPHGSNEINDVDTLAPMMPNRRRRFSLKLIRTWDELQGKGQREVADESSRILAWLKLVPPQAGDVQDALLKLAFGMLVHANEARTIAERVDQGKVPASLEQAVAVFALNKYIYITDRIHGKITEWARIVRFWPEAVQLALWPPDSSPPTSAISDSLGGVVAADHLDLLKKSCDGLIISKEELESLMQSWSGSRSRRKSFGAVSQWHWHWTAASIRVQENSQTPVVDLCKYFRGETPEHLSRVPTEEEIKQVLKLAQAADIYPWLVSRCQTLWRNETKGIHLCALLQLLPEEDFKPSPLQLGALICHREWLANHLHPQRKLHAERRKLFRIATKSYQSVTYPGADELAWHNGYTDSALWAAYWKLPRDLQGLLSIGLDSYCEIDDAESRAEFCRMYFTGQNEKWVGWAIERVLCVFLVPHLLRQNYSSAEIEQLLFNGPAWNREGGGKRVPERSQLWWLIEAIALEKCHKNIERALKTSLPWRK